AERTSARRRGNIRYPGALLYIRACLCFPGAAAAPGVFTWPAPFSAACLAAAARFWGLVGAAPAARPDGAHPGTEHHQRRGPALPSGADRAVRTAQPAGIAGRPGPA